MLGVAEDLHVFEIDLRRAKNVDSDNPGSCAVDRQTAERYRTASRVDDDAGGSRIEDSGDHAATIDGERLRDRHGTETTGVETVDFAQRRGKRNRARECLAGRRNAA